MIIFIKKEGISKIISKKQGVYRIFGGYNSYFEQ